ncbi:hypothetical protein [Pseudoxanthomonas beigongshangi]
MALRRFSDNPAATTPLTGTEVIPGLQGGADVQMTAQDIADLATGTGGNTVTALGTSGAVNIDCALGEYFTCALTGNITSITFSNLPGAGKGATKLIRFTQDATPRTVAWPGSFKWAGGAAGSVSTGAGAVDVLAISTFDNGTTWDATLAQAFA